MTPPRQLPYLHFFHALMHPTAWLNHCHPPVETLEQAPLTVRQPPSSHRILLTHSALVPPPHPPAVRRLKDTALPCCSAAAAAARVGRASSDRERGDRRDSLLPFPPSVCFPSFCVAVSLSPRSLIFWMSPLSLDVIKPLVRVFRFSPPFFSKRAGGR